MASSPVLPAPTFDLQPAVQPAARAGVVARATWRRRLARVARWLHIYGSMMSLAVVLFFSATGLLVNHPRWFAGQERVVERAGVMNGAWLAGADESIDKLAVVEFLRASHEVSGAVNDFRVDGPDASVSFKGPGYSAEAFIDRTTGRYTLTETRLGLAAIVGDLHKGRDTGGVWKTVIDVSAILLCLVSLTGLLLLYFLHKHRAAGIALLALGALATYGIYLAAVP
jgi:hypothetical protein